MIIHPDGGYTAAEGWTGIAVGLNPQYSHPVCTKQNLSIHATISDSWGFTGILSIGISLTWEKQHTGNFSMGMGEAQML